MSRDWLGRLSAGLNARESAAAVAAATCAESLLPLRLRAPDPRGRLRVSGTLLATATAPQSRATGKALAQAWDKLCAGHTGKSLVLELSDTRLGSADTLDLVETLGQAPCVSAVAIVTTPPGDWAEWLWPLDLALFGDPQSDRLRSELAGFRGSKHAQVIAAEIATAPIEMLVMPHTLTEALGANLVGKALPRIQAVMVLGGPGDPATALAHAESLRVAVRADVACVVDLPVAEHRPFLDELLARLFRDQDLDAAIGDLCREGERPAPLLLGCEGGFARARISQWGPSAMQRLTRAKPPMVGAMPPMTVTMTMGKPTKKVAAMGRLARAARPARRKARRVQAQLFAEGKRTPLTKGPLVREKNYALDLWIGQAKEGALSADQDLPEPDFKPGEDGCRLTVVLTAPGALVPVRTTTLWLPQHGESARVRFGIQLTDKADRLDARITLLHESRILQTLRIQAGMGADADPELKLLVETRVRTDFDHLAGRRAFDAALLFNHLADKPTLSVFAKGRASLVETRDIDPILATMMATLAEATSFPKQYGDPSKKGTTELLAKLARQGSELKDALMNLAGVRDDLTKAARIQIIAAHEDRVLPIELCYDAPSPDSGATICPKWKAALTAPPPKTLGKCAGPCPDDLHQVVCPVAFWATSRVIERHSYRKEDVVGLHDEAFVLQTESPDGRSRLNPLAGSLCAAAAQARAEDPKLVDQAFKTLSTVSTPGKEVADWAAWKTEVAKRKPRLMVLLAHTEPKDGTTALVVGQENGTLLGQIDDRFVGAAGAKKTDGPPIVILLGCSTACQERPFQSFVTKFRRAGAAIVVGTLCEILGRHAAPMAATLVEKLNEPGNGSLGDRMLRLRRELLAEGFPIVLAVTAFGDADWNL